MARDGFASNVDLVGSSMTQWLAGSTALSRLEHDAMARGSAEWPAGVGDAAHEAG
jgi:hypothetical protein